MAQRGLGLLKQAQLSRKQLIGFALLSAALNGIITASVGAWLGQTYARYQTRRQSIESLVHLVYERRTRAGMVSSALKRGADIDEVRFRKRAYDEAYVAWNKNIMQNIFAIREVTGEHMISTLEGDFQDGLVDAMSDVDRCLTKAYDARIASADPKPELEKCKMGELQQFVLDCGATFTNELYKLSKLSFVPFSATSGKEGRQVSEQRIKTACTRLKGEPKPASPPMAPALPQTAPIAAAPAPALPETASPVATPAANVPPQTTTLAPAAQPAAEPATAPPVTAAPAQ
jgi:hypothetical protein